MQTAIRHETTFAALRTDRARELLLLGVLVCSLGCGAEARAEEGERGLPPFDAARDVRLSSVAPRFDVGSRTVPENHGGIAPPFAPRASIEAAGSPTPTTAQAPALASSLWQSLNAYRANNRVRLLTLWESTGSALSLQAGRHGEPSLQWTSRALNRGGATRGLLDHLVSKSLGAASLGHPPQAAGRGGAGLSTPSALRPSRPANSLAPLAHAP